MNPHKFSAIAHRDHDYCNRSRRRDRAISSSCHSSATRACSTWAAAARAPLKLVERFQARVTAVDISSPMPMR
jgi:hypothetical protein